MYLKITLIFTILIASLSICSVSEARSLRGSWVSTDGDMVAHIYKHKIRIHFSSRDYRALYWDGSFRPFMKENALQTSKANREVMDSAIMASDKKYKAFRYRNGMLAFWLSILGTKRKIYLRRR